MAGKELRCLIRVEQMCFFGLGISQSTISLAPLSVNGSPAQDSRTAFPILRGCLIERIPLAPRARIRRDPCCLDLPWLPTGNIHETTADDTSRRPAKWFLVLAATSLRHRSGRARA